MKICGLQKTTLLDYPGHVAATVFTGGCNFRCPFCHNSDLIWGDAPEAYSEDEVINFLRRRVGILEGVAITGGEPTLQPDLREFILKVRKFGFRVKLDTNGYMPGVLESLVGEGLIDYVAMDIKAGKTRYPEIAGMISMDMGRVEESVEFLKGGPVPYEFRTTVVKELHSADDFREIGHWIEGCGDYYLQNYVDSGNVLKPVYSGCTKDELLSYANIVRPYVGQVTLRGIDY